MKPFKIMGKLLDQPILIAKFEKKVPYLLSTGGAVYTGYKVNEAPVEKKSETLLRVGTTMMFTRRHGYYQKMGKWCMCNISLVVENFSGGSDSTYQFKVIELPFVNKGTYSAVTIGYCEGINTTYDIKAYIRPNANDIVFVTRNGASITTITGNATSSTMDVQLSFIYQVEE